MTAGQLLTPQASTTGSGVLSTAPPQTSAAGSSQGRPKTGLPSQPGADWEEDEGYVPDDLPDDWQGLGLREVPSAGVYVLLHPLDHWLAGRSGPYTIKIGQSGSVPNRVADIRKEAEPQLGGAFSPLYVRAVGDPTERNGLERDALASVPQTLYGSPMGNAPVTGRTEYRALMCEQVIELLKVLGGLGNQATLWVSPRMRAQDWQDLLS